MKNFLVICLSLSLITRSMPSHAQFFKKLKKAVNNTVSSVSSEINTDAGSGRNSTGGIYTVKATHADLSAYHPSDLYTLQPGEKFDFKESCLAMQAGISSAQVVIIKDGKRYLIGKNGQRIPVTNNNIQGCPATYQTSTDHLVAFVQYAYSAPNVDAEAGRNFENLYVHSSNGLSGNWQMTNNITPQQQAQLEQLADKMEKEQDTGSVNRADAMKAAQLSGGMHIRSNVHFNKDSAGSFIYFNHKRYGPYAMVQSMLVNKAGTKFVAIVIPGEPDNPMIPVATGSLLITSEGVKKKNAFHLASLVPYGDFNHYRLMIKDKMPEVLYDPATGRQVPVINNDVNSIKIDKTTGALIQMINRQIYIDGKPVETLPEKSTVKPKNIFISQDHKQCAIWTFNGLYLPGARVIDGVLSCKKQIQNGKTILSWIVLGSDNKTLYLCHEAI